MSCKIEKKSKIRIKIEQKVNLVLKKYIFEVCYFVAESGWHQKWDKKKMLKTNLIRVGSGGILGFSGIQFSQHMFHKKTK